MHHPVYSNNWFKSVVRNFEQFSSHFSNVSTKGLEIGSFEGQSSNWLVENWCRHESSTLTCVDTFEGSDEHTFAQKNSLYEKFKINTSGNADKIRTIKGHSENVLRQLIENEEKFDFIYIDGDHHSEAVKLDAELSHKLLKSGGLLIFDDYEWGQTLPSWRRPKEAIDFFLESNKKDYKVAVKNYQIFCWKRSTLKIAVYAIAKNESHFVERFYESAKEADIITVADTGSTDDTVSALKSRGCITHQICVSPWRFDVARNAALSLVTADVDVCIALDLDEVLTPGWRQEIEKIWSTGTTRLRYLYDWGNEVRFMTDKIHSRKGYVWRHPCHESLSIDGRVEQKYCITQNTLIKHMPDPKKSRGQYLDLLKLGVEEDPSCSRHSFYYARELTFYKKHAEALSELQRYLSLPSSTWKDERAYAMRLIGNSLAAMGNLDEARDWYEKGTIEAPHRKESWFALAEMCHTQKKWECCLHAAKRCIELPNSTQWPVEPAAQGYRQYDLAALSSYWSGMKTDAILYGEKALQLSPHDERLKKNLAWYRGEI